MLAGNRPAFFRDVQKAYFLVPRAMQYLLPHLFGQILERSIQVESVMGGKTGQHGMRERVAAVLAADGAAGQAQFREGHYSSGIEKIHMAIGRASWWGRWCQIG